MGMSAGGAGSAHLKAGDVVDAHLGLVESFEDFFRREFPPLVALARAVTGSGSAEDLAQEAMLVLYRRWDDVSTLDDPAQWGRRVCLNLSRSVLRRRLVEVRAMQRLGGRRAAPAEQQPQDEEFWAAVRTLPRRQAQATALRYVYDLDVAAIAETMGCSSGSVKVHLGRARAALAQKLGEPGGGLS